MALDDAAADAALDIYVAGLDPAPADPEATKNALRGLVRAIYAGIVTHAVVLPGTMTADTNPDAAILGTGTIS